MTEMLSQAEIDALLNDNMDIDNEAEGKEDFTADEIDALGEIGNISMGTSATTLYTLLGQKVIITTPKVSVTDWDTLANEYPIPYVAVKVEYTEGLKGVNLLIINIEDVKIITDLMMGGDGTNIPGELTDLHLSAIGEAMNQMIGSAATSMSSIFKKKIDISPPSAFVIDFNNKSFLEKLQNDFQKDQKVVKVAFKIVVGKLIDSEIMQLIPIDFAHSMVQSLLAVDANEVTPQKAPQIPPISSEPYKTEEPPKNSEQKTYEEHSQMHHQDPGSQRRDDPFMFGGKQDTKMHAQPVNVQPVQFQDFDDTGMTGEKGNISLIMDVPLEVTVELGRTHRIIKDILEFVPGSIIELDKLAGEPIDILVNGKVIAKGEVVVIDENFGVRITEIVSPSKRL